MQVTRGRWFKNQIELSSSFLAKFPNEFEIHLGAEIVPVINKKQYGVLLLRSFFMPSPKEITITKLGDRLSVGPVLGLMARGVDEDNAKKFIRYFGKTPVLTYVFDESQLYKAQIEGYYYDENWFYMKLPKPNYVFDRTYPSKPENGIKLPRSVFINPITQFSKSQIAKVLKQNGIEVPETFSGTFETAHLKFSFFYLKPDRGSFGQDIFIVTKRVTDFIVYASNSNSLDIYSKKKMVELLNYLEGNGYVLQKGIEPIKLKDEPVDFRLHVLADPHPRLTMIAARTSSWPFLYTSTPRKIIKPNKLLSTADFDRLQELVTKVHYVLSRAYGPYVEISLDVIKEKDTGKFYVIDVNGKSTRVHPLILGASLEEYYRAPEKLAYYFFTNTKIPYLRPNQ